MPGRKGVFNIVDDICGAGSAKAKRFLCRNIICNSPFAFTLGFLALHLQSQRFLMIARVSSVLCYPRTPPSIPALSDDRPRFVGVVLGQSRV
jgi:hypothetical protein